MRSSLACCAAGLTACVGPGMLLFVLTDALVGAGFAVCAGAAIQASITAIASSALREFEIIVTLRCRAVGCANNRGCGAQQRNRGPLASELQKQIQSASGNFFRWFSYAV